MQCLPRLLHPATSRIQVLRESLPSPGFLQSQLHERIVAVKKFLSDKFLVSPLEFDGILSEKCYVYQAQFQSQQNSPQDFCADTILQRLSAVERAISLDPPLVTVGKTMHTLSVRLSALEQHCQVQSQPPVENFFSSPSERICALEQELSLLPPL